MRAATIVFLVVLSCRSEKEVPPAQVAVRWIEGDIAVADVADDGRLDHWQVIAGTNQAPRILKRYGVSLDGNHLCVVTEEEQLFVRPTTSTTSYTTALPLGSFEVDGCIVDRYVNVLAYWRAGSLVRTFSLRSGALELTAEVEFENGALGGPATVEGSATTDLAVLDSPFGRIDTWSSQPEGWQRAAIHIEEGS